MIQEDIGDLAVSVQGVSKRFGTVQALSDVSLDVAPGRFVSLLGPSGCGKTTLMRIIAGLDRQSAGRVLIAGQDLSLAPPHRRPVGLVFQRYALFPHMTVGENVGFALSLRRMGRKATADRVSELLDLVRLGDFADRSIDQLSGGQAQRVALARALAGSPPVLLLDEPMSALDLKLRQAMQLELRQLQRRIGATFLFVTHDQDEAMVMSDEIVLMNNGVIIQRGNCASGAKTGLACVRPESIRIEAAGKTPASSEEPNSAAGQVREAIFQGAFRRYHVQVGEHRVMVQQPAMAGIGEALSQGDAVRLSWPDDAVAQIEDDADADA